MPPASEAQRLTELSSVLLSSADADLRFVFLNGAWERVLGWLPEELVGSSAIDVLHPEERHVLVRAVGEARKTGTAELDFDCRVATRDGRWRWMSWTLRYQDGRWYGAAQDATERRIAERRLAQRETQLRALVEQVPAIVYTAGLGADAPRGLRQPADRDLARLQRDGVDRPARPLVGRSPPRRPRPRAGGRAGHRRARRPAPLGVPPAPT